MTVDTIGQDCDAHAGILASIRQLYARVKRQSSPPSLRDVLPVYERILTHDAIKALCGIESAFFRRRIKTVTLAPSTACQLTLRTASPAGLQKVLEEFGRAGTAFMRLEFIAVYFSQDPKRGGKTAQAMALALTQFLSYIQIRFDDKMRDDRTRQSLLRLATTTRELRHLVIRLSDVICGAEIGDGFFWRLLVNGEFPSGIELLNSLERHLTDAELSDASGKFSRLLQWILAKTAEPFLSVLTTFLWTGVIPLEADPHVEETRLRREQFRETLDAQVKERRDIHEEGKEREAQEQRDADATAVAASDEELRRGKQLLIENTVEQDLAVEAGYVETATSGFDMAELLTSKTNFFRAVVDPKDDQVLREVLDESARIIDTVPFKLLVQWSILLPVDHMRSELDSVALLAVTRRLNVRAHLTWLHRIMLMSEGLCMSVFARDMLTSLRSSTSRSLLAQPGRLSSMLGLALVETRLSKGTAMPPFDYRVKQDVTSFLDNRRASSHVRRMLEEISLNYSFDLELSIVISQQSIENYAHIHRFLLYLRLSDLEFKDAWVQWRKAAHLAAPLMRRKCDLLLHCLHGFLSALHESFTIQVLMAQWDRLGRHLDGARSVVEFRNAHDQFTDDTLACCFLTPELRELHDVVNEVLGIGWALSDMISAAERESGSLDALALALQDLMHRQIVGTSSLVGLVGRLAASSERPAVRDFAKYLLQRLDFSAFLHAKVNANANIQSQ
ncbi:hypothetical protein P43SY_001334 [Pythium insidiosum]|uniref:Spindle pole body component n=1 Tax=Pythium insidiosum TaxID=114742 RepID=A0AAD5Q9J0_PYTIN|nr:hypothetical protein P43SY_001334 [Pythium insidiosum]